jgi:hypothetical protein
VLEVLVEGLDAHGADALMDEIADGVLDHRGDDAGLETKAVGEVGCAVELAAGDVDLAFRCLAERDDTGVEPVNESADADKVEVGGG